MPDIKSRLLNSSMLKPIAPLALAVALVTGPAHATPTNFIYATDPAYGVVADGVTSDDAAMKKAIDACAAAGTTLVLPAGQILMDGTGSATINLKNCHILGQKIQAGKISSVPSMGTTVLLTSTTVSPFYIFDNWALEGINFYWPNQTNGSTVYPPLLSDDGTHGQAHVHIDHVGVINAYDFMQTTSTEGTGQVWITNSSMYAVHDLFRSNNVGDAWHFDANHFDPGQWLGISSFSPTIVAAIDYADQHNTLYHIATGGNGFVSNITNQTAFAWRYGWYLDSGAFVGLSNIGDSGFDGVGTIIDASNGTWAHQGAFHNVFVSCSIPDMASGGITHDITPCFNLGANGGLVLDGIYGQGTSDFVLTSGADVRLHDLHLDYIGNNAPYHGGNYYLVYATGGGLTIDVQGSTFPGGPSGVSGIVATNSSNPGRLMIQGNDFNGFTNAVSISNPHLGVIANNLSTNTGGANSMVLGGGGSVVVANNAWDKP